MLHKNELVSNKVYIQTIIYSINETFFEGLFELTTTFNLANYLMLKVLDHGLHHLGVSTPMGTILFTFCDCLFWNILKIFWKKNFKTLLWNLIYNIYHYVKVCIIWFPKMSFSKKFKSLNKYFFCLKSFIIKLEKKNLFIKLNSNLFMFF